MKNVISILFLTVLLFSYFGCGPSKTDLPGTDLGDLPEWFLTPPSDNDHFYAVATETSRDLQMAIDKAMVTARGEIGRQAEIKLEGLQKSFREEVGLGDDSQLLSQFTEATKTVLNQTLTGSKLKEKTVNKDSNTYRAYILMEYPVGAANVALLEQLKKNEQLYTRFRSTQTFEELDKEIQKYEQQK